MLSYCFHACSARVTDYSKFVARSHVGGLGLAARLDHASDDRQISSRTYEITDLRFSVWLTCGKSIDLHAITNSLSMRMCDDRIFHKQRRFEERPERDFETSLSEKIKVIREARRYNYRSTQRRRCRLRQKNSHNGLPGHDVAAVCQWLETRLV
jgi:hypothetical protein